MVALQAGHVPVLLVRGRDEVLRGFVNVCRHRGSVLCEGEGRRETIQCPYHAWTYDLDGSLRTAPRADREIGFDRDELGLVPVAVETWGPFVFVSPDADAVPLADHLGELPRLLAEGGVDVDALEFSFRAESDPYDANWKVIVENYLECYHCSVAHPSFSKAIDVGVDAYRLETRPTFSSQLAVARNGGGGVYDATGQVDRGQFHALFPSTLINVMPGHAEPVDRAGAAARPGDGRPATSTTSSPRTSTRSGSGSTSRSTTSSGAEDRTLVERVQAGLRTGALQHGHLMPESERLIAHFQSLVLAAVGSED